MSLANELASLEPEQIQGLYNTLAHDSEQFAKIVTGHIVREVPPYQQDIYKLLNKTCGLDFIYKYLALIIFRGGGKSTIKTIRTLQDICHAIEPMILFLSEAEDQSIRDVIQVQDEIEGNEIIHLLYGNLKGAELWSKSQCQFANGVYLGAKGSTSRIRGIKWKSQRPTKYWLDDIESENNTKTDGQRDDIARWIEAQVLFSEAPESKFIFMGTIVHPQSYLAGLENLDMFKPPSGAYYKVAVAKTFDGDEPSWPKRFPKEWILARREYLKQQHRLQFYYQEYFHIASKSGESKFNTSKIVKLEDAAFHKYMNITWIQAKSVPDKIPVYTFLGVDPNARSADGSDCLVIFTIAIPANGKPIIVNIFNDVVAPEDHAEKVLEEAERWKPKQIVIETYAYQSSLAGWVRKLQREKKTFYPVVEFDTPKSKKTKYVEGLIPYINRGEVAYLPSCENIDVFFQQAESYNSNERDKDDTLDGFYLSLHEHFKPSKINIDKKISDYKKRNKDTQSRKRPRTWNR